MNSRKWTKAVAPKTASQAICYCAQFGPFSLYFYPDDFTPKKDYNSVRRKGFYN